jgi:transposase
MARDPASDIWIEPEIDCGSWLDGLQSRMHPNKAVVALAAKMARIVWVVLTKPGALYERRDPAFA